MKKYDPEVYIKKLEQRYTFAIKHVLKQDKNRDAFATREYLKMLEEHLKELGGN